LRTARSWSIATIILTKKAAQLRQAFFGRRADVGNREVISSPLRDPTFEIAVDRTV